jgi:hypothetical protein
MKKCSKCKTVKPLSEFNKNKNKRNKDGHSYTCRKCTILYRKEYFYSLCVCGNIKRKESKICKLCTVKIRRENAQGNKIKTKCGYILIRDNSHPNANKQGYVFEHRLVMEASFTPHRYLTKEETVHHINGIKDDNRIENLELWSTSQPKGQRVQDKIEWAKEILEQYQTSKNIVLWAKNLNNP